MEVTKESIAIWENILDYEKSYFKAHSNTNIPFNKLLDYFGVKNICAIYGCKIPTTTIAMELIKEAFK